MAETLVKCRLCGAELLMAAGEESKRCAYCRTVNARPKATGDTLNILNLATEQRLAQDFYHAEESYRQVLALQKDEYEARWGLALCKYGVDYVRDPRSGRQMPVCHTVRIRPMREDADYQRACELAPAEVRAAYEADAAYIDATQQRIRELQLNEPGYDIFLCYKETAIDSNDTTEESRVARRLYNDLTRKGYRVFYAPESLAAVVGENYEAGICHGIETAKVMLVIGTRPDHLTSAWVQSEWSRYLERIDNGEDKHLVPLYGGMRAGELPAAFRHRNLQGLCMDELAWQEKLETALLRWLDDSAALAGDAGAEDAALQALLNSGAVSVSKGDFAAAMDCYQNVADRYPEDHRGWWGLIVCATENLQKPAADQPRLDAWFKRAQARSDGRDRNGIRAPYARYLRLVAEEDVAEEIRALEQERYTFTQDRELTEAELAKQEAEIQERKRIVEGSKQRLEETRKELSVNYKGIKKKKRPWFILVIALTVFLYCKSMQSFINDNRTVANWFGFCYILSWIIYFIGTKKLRKCLKDIRRQIRETKKAIKAHPSAAREAQAALDSANTEFQTKRQPLDSAIQQASAKEAEYTAKIEEIHAHRAEMIDRYHRQRCEAVGIELTD